VSALLLLLLATNPPAIRIQQGGTTQGQAHTLNCGANVTCTVSGGKAAISASGGSGSPGGASGNLQTNDGAGGFGAYAGSSCGANQYATSTNASGALTCGGVSQLSANGANCAAGNAPLGVDASGASEGCFAVAAASHNHAGGDITSAVASATALAANPTDCSAGQYANAIAASGNLSCGQVAYSELSGAPSNTITTVRDEGSPLTARSSINFTGSGVACADDAANSRTNCTISKLAGGTTGQVQFNNGGNLDGINNILTDGVDLIVGSQDTDPAAHSSTIKVFARRNGAIVLPKFLKAIDAQHQLSYAMGFPFTSAIMARYGCSLPVGFNNSTISHWGLGNNSTAGTTGLAATGQSWANTTLGRTIRVRYAATSGANAYVRVFQNAQGMWRGDVSGAGGFFWWASFAIGTSNSTARVFAGLRASTSVMSSGTGDPSADTNMIGFAVDSANTNLSICSNDSSGTATCNSLGASYPAKTVGALYTIYLWAPPNSSSVSYGIQRHDSANSTTGTISSDLPATTQPLGWELYNNAGSNAAAPTIDFAGQCMVSGF